ncbi:MAG: hypothetical protein WD360_02840 [Nitriliruptoraceae bacterium]
MGNAVHRALIACAFCAMLLVSCSSQNGPVVWRNITVDLPEGWVVFERTDTTLSIANVPLGPQEDGAPRAVPDGEVVAMFFSYEPDTLPRDWLEFLAANGAEIETQQQRILTGDVPATQVVYRLTDEITDTREMVVLIPSRNVVILAQPVPSVGDSSGPDVFLRNIDTFLTVVDTLNFGAPVVE